MSGSRHRCEGLEDDPPAECNLLNALQALLPSFAVTTLALLESAAFLGMGAVLACMGLEVEQREEAGTETPCQTYALQNLNLASKSYHLVWPFSICCN